jgi:hypothetical protein
MGFNSGLKGLITQKSAVLNMHSSFQCRPRCTVRTFNATHAAGVRAEQVREKKNVMLLKDKRWKFTLWPAMKKEWERRYIDLLFLLTDKSNKMQHCIKMLLFLTLNKVQHVSDDTLPIIKSLKLHKQPLVLHNNVGGCRTYSCWTLSDTVCLTTSNNCTSENLPQYYGKPEAACVPVPVATLSKA